MTLNHIIIEGCDRMGKDTLIRGIQDRLGYFQVLHFQKPLLLERYLHNDKISLKPRDAKIDALRSYQANSFINMFRLMNKDTKIICNRAHLGETVYAKRYRGYDGNYVFDIEKSFYGTIKHVLLVLLYTSDFSFILDDGQSLDVGNREVEQTDFLTAYDRSLITHKMKIDVCNGNGGFIPAQEILDIVCSKLEEDE